MKTAPAARSPAPRTPHGAPAHGEAHQVTAQALDLEMLEIGDALANLAGRRAQKTQGLRVRIEEIGMPAQIGDDLAAADLARQFGCRAGVALAQRLVTRELFVAREI